MLQKETRSLGVVLAILGVVLFSAKAIMVKLAYEYEIDSVSLLLLRMLFSLPIYVLIAVFVKPEKAETLRKTDYFWLIFFFI